VIDGFETLDAIEQLEVDKKNKPINPIKIINIQIHANPIAT
jgi:peptidyl-prolyl cis-trans isomerase-like 3